MAATRPSEDTRIHFRTRSIVSERTLVAIDSRKSANRTGKSSILLRLIPSRASRSAGRAAPRLMGKHRPPWVHVWAGSGDRPSAQVDGRTIDDVKHHGFEGGVRCSLCAGDEKDDDGLTVER